MDIELSERIQSISESMTLKMSERARTLAKTGKKIYNLTAGELPFRPPKEFVHRIEGELGELESYHYSPVAGISELREKIMYFHQETRNIQFADVGEEMDCLISHGGKQALANFFASWINPGDEVVVISPYWTSYPEQIKVHGGKVVMVNADRQNSFVPDLEQIHKSINSKTKAIVINSPNNPTGIHYPTNWMEEFVKFMTDYPELMVVSDEIYYLLNYKSTPTYYYQKNPQLLQQTIIIDGISKFFASTGLRLGWAIAPKKLIRGMSSFQGQTTSGANSLVQRSLLGVDLPLIESYLEPIKKHLKDNANTLKDICQSHGMEDIYYQTTSAFYSLMDFSETVHSKGMDDCSGRVCEELLDRHGIVTAPGSAFGTRHSIRINLAVEKNLFSEAIEVMVRFMKG